MFKTFWQDDELMPLRSYIFTKVVAEQDMRSPSQLPLQSYVDEKESNSYI